MADASESRRTDSDSCEGPPVEIAAYDDAWPQLFEIEAQVLQAVLAEWLVAPIEHVGSTAVQDLPAKPVIDIMAPVAGLDASVRAIDAATSIGYKYSSYQSDLMHWFCKPSSDYRTHHLYLVPYGSVLWVERITFRDTLRRYSHVALEYGNLKYALARQYRCDRESYTRAKGPFIRRVLSERGRQDGTGITQFR
jgi:GrpB-like predicted nucleotidyltransferase (UPF0157 family)